MRKPDKISVWPDIAAFALGIVFAAFNGWDTHGLVWSLWLASLVVGYALIVVSIIRLFRPATANTPPPPAGWENTPIGRGFSIPALLFGIFLLGFFTLHFGGFHWGHSIFLNLFFPIDDSGGNGLPDLDAFREVARQGWWFVPLALVAQRAAFREPAFPPLGSDGKPMHPLESGVLAPYKNVVRLHLLIFFFAFAHFLGLPAAFIYLAVYAVYFFPWSVLRNIRGRAKGDKVTTP